MLAKNVSEMQDLDKLSILMQIWLKSDKIFKLSYKLSKF